MRTETEIRSALKKLETTTVGSYEELAGAEEALRWVLGEGGLFEVGSAGGTPEQRAELAEARERTLRKALEAVRRENDEGIGDKHSMDALDELVRAALRETE